MGTVTDSIIFTSSSTTPNFQSWVGMRFYSDSGGAINSSYCRLEYANYLLDFWNGSYPPQSNLKHCLFQNNNSGVQGAGYWDTLLVIDSSAFIDNNIGVGTHYPSTAITGRSIYILNSFFNHNGFGTYSTEGIYLLNCTFCGNGTGIQSNGNDTISNCTIVNNYWGINAEHYGHINLINSIVVENETGIRLGSQFASITDNIICHNHVYNVAVSSIYSYSLLNTCWCDTNSAVIANSIYDNNDNAIYGLIYFGAVNCDSSAVNGIPSCTPFTNGIEEQSIHPNTLKIFPNPFSDFMNIEFNIETPTDVSLDIYDMNGRKISSLINNQKLEGRFFSRQFDMRFYDDGIYQCRLQYGNKIETRKLILIH